MSRSIFNACRFPIPEVTYRVRSLLLGLMRTAEGHTAEGQVLRFDIAYAAALCASTRPSGHLYILRGATLAMRSKSASLWSRVRSFSIAVCAIRQSTVLLIVIPFRRQPK